MILIQRFLAAASIVFGLASLTGCAATSMIAMAVEQTPAAQGLCLTMGCAAKEIAVYAYDKYTEGDPTPCRQLNSVARALSGRCGPYERGSLVSKDVRASGLPQCPLSVAARDPALWPVLPELLALGASPEPCITPPLAALAQAQACPDFGAASAESLQALRWLATADARSVHHDVVRMLSCPNARSAGLDRLLDGWLAQGQMPARALGFSPLAALHPDHLDSPFARALEAQGHSARDAFGGYEGRLPGGFDLALRGANIAALDWWLDRVPELVQRVPAVQGNQSAWMPLARVLQSSYLVDAAEQGAVVEYLLARGADPLRRFPHDRSLTVLAFARQLRSPSLGLLEAAVAAPPAAIRLAADAPRTSAHRGGVSGLTLTQGE